MEKRSKHYGDVAKWVESVIDSCVTIEQVWSARELVRNFRIQLDWSEYKGRYRWDIIHPLEDKVKVMIDKLSRRVR
tara:strand:+ start:971 stop:1198 length:228 start_codon:yes stop_codon:yes gene_type:complete